VGAAASVAVMAFDGEGWHDSTFDPNDGAGLLGFMMLTGAAVVYAAALRRRGAHRWRLRRRMGQALEERNEARVDVNHAPPRLLAKLPHVGHARARQMVELRPFSSVEDLGAVLGLSADAVEELRPVTAFKARACR
jgi:hypothetical protein